LTIAKELAFGDAREAERIDGLSVEVGKMLTAILKKL